MLTTSFGSFDMIKVTIHFLLTFHFKGGWKSQVKWYEIQQLKYYTMFHEVLRSDT
jgi:hypothetical protein